MKIKAYAKINIALDVVKKRDDGYHDVKMIMQTVSLCDSVDVYPIYEGGKTQVHTNNDKIPSMEGNIAYKAALAFFEMTDKKDASAKIFIKKNIPFGAGLAGGSADAAAVIIALNEIFKTNLTKNELCKIGAKVGAVVPFCIMKNTYLAEGIGNVLTRIPNFKSFDVLIVKPNFAVETPYVYKNLVLDENIDHPDVDKIAEAIFDDNSDFVFENSKNVLESVVMKMHPEIAKIKDDMKKYGAKMALMSGSGPSVFGIFENEEKCVDAYNYFKNTYNETFLTKTVCNV